MIEVHLQIFGGRGASSGIKGGGGRKYQGEITLPDGSKIEFDGELRFGEKDTTLSKAERTTIEDWENKKYKLKNEQAMAIRSDGSIIGQTKGGRGSVRTPYDFTRTPDSTLTHNHPREGGMLGGTFSDADLFNFSNFNNKTMRATAKEGTYSISKLNGFDAKGLMQYFKQENKKNRSAYNAAIKQIDANSKNKTFEEMQRAYAKAANNYLISEHNSLLAGAKTYKYVYTLEQRTI